MAKDVRGILRMFFIDALFFCMASSGAFRPCPIKNGNKTLIGRFFLLDISVFNTERFHVRFRLFVFFIGNPAVDFRKLFRSSVRRVLPHKTEKDIPFTKRFRHIFQNAFRVFHLPRQNEVSDKDTFF